MITLKDTKVKKAIAFDDDKRDYVVVQRYDESFDEFVERAKKTLMPNRESSFKIAILQ